MDPPRLATPKVPVVPDSLRISQEQELSATAFGRALLEATRLSRKSHYVVDRIESKSWACPICESEFRAYGANPTDPKITNGSALGAGHDHPVYCNYCLTSWIKAKLEDNTCEVRCLMDKCNTLLDQAQLGTQLSKALHSRWNNARLCAALAKMPDLRYCPTCQAPGFLAPGCAEGECRECKYNFCPTCMLPKHAAIRCSAAVYELDPEVQRKFYCERLCEAWKSSHTKQCPQCKAAIEKNEGCSHMTCRSCRYEFCWICMQKYQGKYVTGAAANGDLCPCPRPPPRQTP